MKKKNRNSGQYCWLVFAESGQMSKKGISRISNEKQNQRNQKEYRDSTYHVCTMGHCFQGPCQGLRHIPPKRNLTQFYQKVKKNRIRMIVPVRVHAIGCWKVGHMTNVQKQKKQKLQLCTVASQMCLKYVLKYSIVKI